MIGYSDSNKESGSAAVGLGASIRRTATWAN